jgi:8-oxo-dGTP pyrophosphatase MutT (NUDIX family)
MTIIDKLAWIHVVDGRVLCARSRGNEAFYVPGGKRDAGESDLDALAREIREELSVDIVRAAATHYGTFEAQAHGKADGVRVRTTCYRAPFGGVLTPASEIEEIAWLANSDRARLTSVGLLVFDRLHEDGLLPDLIEPASLASA